MHNSARVRLDGDDATIAHLQDHMIVKDLTKQGLKMDQQITSQVIEGLHMAVDLGQICCGHLGKDVLMKDVFKMIDKENLSPTGILVGKAHVDGMGAEDTFMDW